MLKEVSYNEFQNEFKDGLVLVDFFSTTCGPCKMLSFMLDEIDKEFQNELKILKVNFNENEKLIKEYNITGYPTLILLKNGTEIKRVNGLQSKPNIIKLLKEHI